MYVEPIFFKTRNENKKKKINFKRIKSNTICSLNEVEHFLCCCHKAVECKQMIEFVKIIKENCNTRF